MNLAVKIATHAHRHRRRRSVMRRDHLGPRFQHHGENRNDRKRTRSFFPRIVHERSYNWHGSAVPRMNFVRSRYRILHPRPQRRRWKRKRRVLLVVDVVDAFRIRIIAMQVRPRIRRLLRHTQPEIDVEIIPRLHRLRLGLSVDRVPSGRNIERHMINQQRQFRAVVKRQRDHKLLSRRNRSQRISFLSEGSPFEHRRQKRRPKDSLPAPDSTPPRLAAAFRRSGLEDRPWSPYPTHHFEYLRRHASIP